jgi:Lrp/AsnC family transcriptional regulator
MEEYNKFYTKLTDKIDIFSVATSFSMEEIKQTSSLPLNYV